MSGGDGMADAHFPLEDYFGFDIRSFAVPVQFESGDIILSEGEANDALFFLEFRNHPVHNFLIEVIAA